MVHVKKCPCELGRGRATTEFYINGKPQIYCLGWIDSMTDEPLEVCQNCKDWVNGEQCKQDFKKWILRKQEEFYDTKIQD